MKTGTHSVRIWFMWSLVGFIYALALFQRAAPQTILDHLMADFRVGASQIGIVVSAYLYGYTMMQIPAGVIVDQWGVRGAVLLSLGLSTIGTLWFAHTTTLHAAAATRALAALGDALILSAFIKVSAQWFPANRFGLMSGLTSAWGHFGALLATTPLAVMVSLIGWRGSFSVVAYLTIVNFLLSLIFLCNHPSSVAEPQRRFSDIFRDVVQLLQRRTTWGHVLTFTGAYVTTVSLAGVWGVPLFMQAYGLSRTAASLRMLAFMVCYACGAIGFGYLKDAYVQSPRKALAVIGVIRPVLLLAITPMLGAHLSIWLIMGCLAILGLIGGGTNPFLFTSLKQVFTSARIATATGIMITAGNVGGGVVQPWLGRVLEHHWAGMWSGAARLYTAEGYTWLLVILAALSLCAVIGPLCIEKDRACREDVLAPFPP